MGPLYTKPELNDLISIWDELEKWGAQKRKARFGKAPVSARMVHAVATERGLKVAASGKGWSYETTLRVLQKVGKVRLPPRDRPVKGVDWATAAAASAAAGAADASPVQSKQRRPQGADALFAFLEADLGAFIRPEDRARAQQQIDGAIAKKINELTTELVAKTATRVKLDMYGSVYDRLIARLTHRISLLREKGIDPEVQDQIDAAEEARDDADAVAVHESAVHATPYVFRRRARER